MRAYILDKKPAGAIRVVIAVQCASSRVRSCGAAVTSLVGHPSASSASTTPGAMMFAALIAQAVAAAALPESKTVEIAPNVFSAAHLPAAQLQLRARSTPPPPLTPLTPWPHATQCGPRILVHSAEDQPRHVLRLVSKCRPVALAQSRGHRDRHRLVL
jgi:hypothetical protein